MSAENVPAGAPDERAATILDAGKLRRKTIKALKRGRGRIMEQVDEIAAEAAPAEGRTLLRVVILVRKPPRRRG